MDHRQGEDMRPLYSDHVRNARKRLALILLIQIEIPIV